MDTAARFNVGDTASKFAASGPKRPGLRRPLETLQADKGPAQQASRRTGAFADIRSRWFYSLGMLNHWGRSAQEFFVQAAGCAVGVDRVRRAAIVVRRRDQNWEIVASHLPMPELGIHCDLHVLDQLLKPAANHVPRSGTFVQDTRRAGIDRLAICGQLAGSMPGGRSPTSHLNDDETIATT